MILSDPCTRVVAALQCGDPRCECHRNPNSGRNGLTVRVHCPAHDDPHPDLTVTDLGAGKWPLLHCHSQRCPQEAIIEALRSRGVWPGSSDSDPVERPEEPYRSHVYVDEYGKPLHRTNRQGSGDTKKITQEFLVPPGRWMKRAPKGQRYVLYRLPHLLAAPENSMICLTEGEKNAEDLIALGFIATTNAMGALAWRPEYNRFFAGHLIPMFEDNDDEGRRRSELVAPQLIRTGAVVKVIRLPGLTPKGDVSDWIARGGTKEQLEQIIDESPIWTPPPPVDPTDLDRELDAILASERATADWTYRREGDDFTFWFPDRARFRVRGVYERAGGLTTRLEVDHPAYGRLDFTSKFDFSSRSQHKDLIQVLSRKASGLDWEHHLDEVTYVVDHEFSRGHPSISIEDIELLPAPSLAMSPNTLLNEPNILLGIREHGKSLTAQIMAVSWVTETPLPGEMRPHPSLCGPLLYLDWETNAFTFKRRIANIADVLRVDVTGLIRYKRMDHRLSLAAADLRVEIARRGIRAVIIDSWKHACGSNTTGDPADAVNEAFAALRTLERTSLIIAHPPRSYERDEAQASVYGSSFSENDTRSVVIVKRLSDRASLNLQISLRQDKANELFPTPPIGLTYIREAARDCDGNSYPHLVAIKTHDLTTEPEAQVSDYAKLKAVLFRARGRHMPTAEIASITGIGRKTLLNRFGDHRDEIGSAPDPQGNGKVWFLLDTRHEDPEQ